MTNRKALLAILLLSLVSVATSRDIFDDIFHETGRFIDNIFNDKHKKPPHKDENRNKKDDKP